MIVRIRGCLLLGISFIFFACGQQRLTIAEIKSVRKAGPQGFAPWRDEDIKVDGYYFQDPLPMLLTDAYWSVVNKPMPDSVYIVLNPELLGLSGQMRQGSRVRLRGRLNSPSDTLRGSLDGRPERFDVDLDIWRSIRTLQSAPVDDIAPAPLDNCEKNPQLCQASTLSSPNYAVLFSGGKDYGHSHFRYWNNLVFIYQVLKSKYGYPDDHIIVLYREGQGEQSRFPDGPPKIPVHYPASKAGLDAAMARLQSNLTGKENVFLYFSNHGGGYDKAKGTNDGGLSDDDMDEQDFDRLDETCYYYKDTSVLTDDDLASRVNRLQFANLVGIFQECFGGGLLRDLRGERRILISASTDVQSSFGFKKLDYDIFTFHFISAINGSTPQNKKVNADVNKDGRVSLLEAFLYAIRQDASAIPWLEDNGDGNGIGDPQEVPGKDGFNAERYIFR